MSTEVFILPLVYGVIIVAEAQMIHRVHGRVSASGEVIASLSGVVHACTQLNALAHRAVKGYGNVVADVSCVRCNPVIACVSEADSC